MSGCLMILAKAAGVNASCVASADTGINPDGSNTRTSANPVKAMTSDKVKHLPLPWKAIGSIPGCGNPRFEIRLSRSGEYFSNGTPSVIVKGESAQDNAEYIVKACNLFPELVEALERVCQFQIAPDLTDQGLSDMAAANGIAGRNDRATIRLTASPYRDNAHALRTEIERAKSILSKARGQ